MTGSQTAVLECSSAVKTNKPCLRHLVFLFLNLTENAMQRLKFRLDLVYVAQPGPLILSDGSMKGMTMLGAHHYLTGDTRTFRCSLFC